MLINRDVFANDPLTSKLPNEGVAKVVEPSTPQEWDVLRYELSTFVCDGEYRVGLERILSSFAANLGEATQPAFWIAGFYGSGKSHLARVLEFLWRDVPFPDGARARGLVTLPDEIKAYLTELSTAGRRDGGLWSAAGSLGGGAGKSVRLALVSVFCKSAGLPAQYPAARFVLWLKKNGYYESVKSAVTGAGKNFADELRELHVSPVIAKAVLGANPSYETETAVRDLLRVDFPKETDIDDDQMVAILRDVMASVSETPGKMPLTLVLLDEVQQYLASNADQTLNFQMAVEACCAGFSSRLLFVATGQSALQASPQLSKLQGRFSRPIQLSDKDVETVVRQVILRKVPSREKTLEATLDGCSGEINRHLGQTKLAPIPGDKATLLPDYPLLPTRRRFWERVLRAVDRAGAAGQLRTQLRVVHEALREVAEKPIGWVVPADLLYTQLAESLIQQGVLLREIHEIIVKQDDGTVAGRMRMRLCATTFLINQLPTELGADTGLRATAETLADLLVEDLPQGSMGLRQTIPSLLVELVDAGSLMQVAQEYRLQTRESAEWEADYRARFQKNETNELKLAGDRTAELRTACQGLKSISFAQGVSKTPRKVELHFGADVPSAETGAIPIWIRDEWAVGEKAVRQEAQAASTDSPIVFVFLPKRSPDEFAQALAGLAAAKETLDFKGSPPTREGQEARQSIVSRQSEQRLSVTRIVDDILKGGRVFQGGGNEVVAVGLTEAAREASEAAAARLYPDFGLADDSRWEKVKTQARDGNGDALAAIGYAGDVDKHPACNRVLNVIGQTGKTGLSVRKHFMGTPYGWPQDAVDGALLVLTAAGLLRATRNGQPVLVKSLDQAGLGQTEFQAEGVFVTTLQRIAVRKLLTDAGFTANSGGEAIVILKYVTMMLALADAAGGQPPAPLRPTTDHLETLQGKSGNELVFAVYELRDRLGAEFPQWTALKLVIATRLPRWQTLGRLLHHAYGLPIHDIVAPQAEAIRANRSLLADPDPVAPLCDALTDSLRGAVTAARQHWLDEYGARIDDLLHDADWQRLSPSDQQQIRVSNGLTELGPLKVGTEPEVLATLDAIPLPNWSTETDALAARVSRALLEAAKRLAPTAVSVTLPGATLKTAEDVDAHLMKIRDAIMPHIDAGHPVVI